MKTLNIFNLIREDILLSNLEWVNFQENCNRLQLQITKNVHGLPYFESCTFLT